MALHHFAHNLNIFIFCRSLVSYILYSTQVLRVIAFVLKFFSFEHVFERLRLSVRHYWWSRENKVELRLPSDFELYASFP